MKKVPEHRMSTQCVHTSMQMVRLWSSTRRLILIILQQEIQTNDIEKTSGAKLHCDCLSTIASFNHPWHQLKISIFLPLESLWTLYYNTFSPIELKCNVARYIPKSFASQLYYSVCRTSGIVPYVSMHIKCWTWKHFPWVEKARTAINMRS